MDRIEFDPTVHVETGWAPECPICGQRADVYKRKIDPTDVFEGWCDRCGGNVRITESAVQEAEAAGKRHVLTSWMRRLSLDARQQTVKREDVARALRDSPSYSVLEKLDIALSVLADMTSFPGYPSSFDFMRDYPLFYAVGEDEAAFYVQELKRRGFLEGALPAVKVLAAGYEHLATIQKSGWQSNQVFVAMWFDVSMRLTYDSAIEPAIREAGYKPLRLDRHEHVNRIDDEIIAQIRRSRFMVADLTGQRQGVYYEAGFVAGLGRNVIWMCRKEQLQDVHFDNRQFNFIDYESESEAKTRLYNRILAIEGEGPKVQKELK
jgi:hypothetical protein